MALTQFPSEFERQVARLEARARYAPRVHSRPAEKLAPLRRLLGRLGHPERGPQVVHLAGTNGKGTTAAMVGSLLQRQGARVGLYTSPHLADIRERIRIQGEPVSREAFARATAAVLDSSEAMTPGDQDGLSWFDLLTAAGFVALREQTLDWWIMETGLGGTADSTNVTEKALAILTPIGHDHMAVLGADLRAIAAQKLGIVPPGTPAVLAPQLPEIAGWMAGVLAAQGSPVLPAERIALTPAPAPFPMPGAGAVSVSWPGAPVLTVPLPAHRITAPHLVCAATALAALDRLCGPPGGERERRERAATALETALPGRQQLIEGATLAATPGHPLPRLLLDGAHNREALAALVETLGRWGWSDCTLILSLLEDKMVEAVREPLAALLGRARRVIGVHLPVPRAPRPEALGRYLAALLPPARREAIAVTGAAEALALASATPGRPVVATGSLWMVGELLKALRVPEPAQALSAATAGREAGPGLESSFSPIGSQT